MIYFSECTTYTMYTTRDHENNNVIHVFMNITGASGSSPVLNRFCSDRTQRTVSSGGDLYIVFNTSASAYHGRGLFAHIYTSVSGKTLRHINAILDSAFWNGRSIIQDLGIVDIADFADIYSRFYRLPILPNTLTNCADFIDLQYFRNYRSTLPIVPIGNIYRKYRSSLPILPIAIPTDFTNHLCRFNRFAIFYNYRSTLPILPIAIPTNFTDHLCRFNRFAIFL